MLAKKIWLLLALGAAGVGTVLLTRRRKIKKDFGAFIERINLLPPLQIAELSDAPVPLTGLVFAIDELFDVKEYVTGFGNPDWRRTHEPAIETAPAVSLLIQGGGTCVGRSIMSEMGFSIKGENKHYGTPFNPADPSRIPGGSSSGSAVAVAAELVDFSLGFDRGGGVRVPAAFCGILGFKPSYGAVSTTGVVPMAQSFDTVGWFARDPDILHRVGRVLLQLPFMESRKPMRILCASDCLQLTNISRSQTMGVVTRVTEKLFGHEVVYGITLGEYFARKIPSLKYFQNENSRDGGGISALNALSNAFQVLQRYEFKQNHKDWVNEVNPDLGPGTSARIYAALETSIDDEKVIHSLTVRNEAREALTSLLKDDGILVIPTTPGPPPKLNMKENLLKDFWIRASTLLSIAGMSGCCQVSIPVGQLDKGPLAVSFIAGHGGDMFLLDFVQAIYYTLQEHIRIPSSIQPAAAKDPTIEAAEMAHEKGIAAYTEKQWQKAIELFSEAIKLNGNKASYYSKRAAAHIQLRSYAQAEEDCTAAIALNKKNFVVYLRRGIARERLGYWTGAVEDLRHLLLHDPPKIIERNARFMLKRLLQ